MNRLTLLVVVCAVLLVAILSFFQWRMHPRFTGQMGHGSGHAMRITVTPSQ